MVGSSLMYIKVLEIGQCVGFLEEAEIRKTLKDYHLCKWLCVPHEKTMEDYIL